MGRGAEEAKGPEEWVGGIPLPHEEAQRLGSEEDPRSVLSGSLFPEAPQKKSLLEHVEGPQHQQSWWDHRCSWAKVLQDSTSALNDRTCAFLSTLFVHKWWLLLPHPCVLSSPTHLANEKIFLTFHMLINQPKRIDSTKDSSNTN